MESVIKAGSRKLQTVVFGGVQISGEWECVRGRFRGEYYLKKYIRDSA